MGAIEDENVKMVETMYEAFKNADLATLLAMLDDDLDLEVHGPSTIPFAGKFRGRAAIEEFFAIVGEHTERRPEDPMPEVQELVAQGDKVVAIGVDRVRSRATGAFYDGWWVHVLELRDGKVVRVREFIDTAAAHAMFQGHHVQNGVHGPQ